MEKLLKFFTFLDLGEIHEIMSKVENQMPQRILAREVTELVHGEQAALRAQVKSAILFDGSGLVQSAKDILDAFCDDDRLVKVSRNNVIGQNIINVAANVQVLQSKSAARKLIASGGLYFGDVKITDANFIIQSTSPAIVENRVCLFRSGKSNYRIVELID